MKVRNGDVRGVEGVRGPRDPFVCGADVFVTRSGLRIERMGRALLLTRTSGRVTPGIALTLAALREVVALMAVWARRQARWHGFVVRPSAAGAFSNWVAYHVPPGATWPWRVIGTRPPNAKGEEAARYPLLVGVEARIEDRVPAPVTGRFSRVARVYRAGEPCLDGARVKVGEAYTGPYGLTADGERQQLCVRGAGRDAIWLHAHELPALLELLPRLAPRR